MTCFIAVWICLCIAASDMALRESISFQVHSYDDMREWRSAFGKGMRNFKIDPNFKDATFCATQTQVNRTDPRGCILLNHDDPVVTRTTYNSSVDVVRFLNDSAHADLFATSRRVEIALCFKRSSPLHVCNDTNWLSFVDDWIADMLQVISTRRLNVELILDGGASPDYRTAPCLVNRWRPLVSTWIFPPGDPIEALFNNSASRGYDRYQVLNPPALPLPQWLQPFFALAAVHYGKFVNSTYSFQVWEPSDWILIEEVLGIYVDTGILHKPSMRMAINIDPIQYQLYAASTTLTAMDEAVYPVVSTVVSLVPLACKRVRC
jgi:hypothetical protein